jgi:hypothetical protein
MLEKSKLVAGSVLSIAVALLLILALGSENGDSSTAKVMVGLAILLWALGILFFGLYLARCRGNAPSFPISLSVVLGVVPTVFYSCIALLPVSVIGGGVAQSVLSLVELLLVPLNILTSQLDWFSGAYTSHGSARGLVRSWMGITSANIVLWSSAGCLVQAAISSWSKHRVGSSDRV